MDFNLPEMKQEKLAEGIANAPNHLHGDEIPNEKGATASATKLPDASFDLLGDIQQDVAKSGSAADENYFGDNHKMSSGGSDLGFEHVDPNAFAYGMNEKAASAMNEFSDFLGKPLSKNLADATQDFMNSERDFLGHQSAAGHLAESLMDIAKKPSDHVATTSQKIADIYDDDFFRAPKTSTTEVSDAATESPPVSCNPSPVKKNPVTDALKEQENEKFISSEDLLGDFKDDRSATPEFHGASESNTNNKQSAPKSQKIVTDLDDDKPVVVSKQTPSAPEHSTLPNVPKAPAPVVEQAKMPTNPSNKYTKRGSKDSSNKDPKILSVEAVFYKYGLDAWFKPERLHPRVESLIYWRDVKKSGIVFGAGLVTLLAISCFSVISVFAYLSLISLTGTIGFRIYKSVTQAIQKTSDGHPFKEFLELDLNLSQEKIQQFVSVAVAHINGFVAELRRLFLVEDLIDSLKFGVILWVMTYIGAWFNGMTLVILAFVSLFTLPKVYENNKQSIDTYLDLVRSKLTDITDKVKVAIPIGNKKPIATETDKDK